MDPAYSQLGCNHEPIYSYICRQITDIGYSEFCNFHLHKIRDGASYLEIPNSVTYIGSRAFWYCSNLSSLVVEEGNPIYDSRDNCNAIIETASNTLIFGCQNTLIPNSVTSIGIFAFSGCSNLTSIDIPNTVTSIGGFAFSGCSNLTSIDIPNTITTIGSLAFENCI